MHAELALDFHAKLQYNLYVQSETVPAAGVSLGHRPGQRYCLAHRLARSPLRCERESMEDLLSDLAFFGFQRVSHHVDPVLHVRIPERSKG